MENADRLIAELIDLEPIKTWSLIVTLFGDFEGEQLTGKQLREFLDPIGVKPEALRVALHRLKKDNWITSEKNGREMGYRLSEKGKRETRSAYRDVYRRDVKHPNGWQLVLKKESTNTTRENYAAPDIPVGRGLCLRPAEIANNNDQEVVLSIESKLLPNWFEERLLSADTILLAEQLQQLALLAEAGISFLPLSKQVTIRLLLLHRWRKLALRKACWAHIRLFPKGALAQCHSIVTRVLATTDNTQLMKTQT